MTNMTKKLFAIFACLIILGSITMKFLPVLSIAATSSELQNKKNELQNSINEASERQEDIKEEVNQTLTELDKLNDEISKKEYEIEEVTAELNKLNSEVDELTKKLNEAQKKYDEQYDLLCERIVAQYKRGSVSYLDVLLKSENLTDFLSGYYIIEKIAEWDTQILDDIEKQKQEIEISKKELEQKQSQVAEKKTQLKVEESTLSNKKANKNKYISQLSEEEQKLQSDIESYNEELKQTDRELQEIARQAAAKANANGHVYTGGKLEWPVPVYSRISSYFGYRGSAATGGVGTANHNGYDIAAPHYSNVVAAESGTVIKVIRACSHDYPKTYATKCRCGGGYGNYLMIDHGGKLVTLYGHLADISVNVGDSVSRGQVIGRVGSCGWSTGYHLHFSVLANGSYVNPGNYIGS